MATEPGARALHGAPRNQLAGCSPGIVELQKVWQQSVRRSIGGRRYTASRCCCWISDNDCWKSYTRLNLCCLSPKSSIPTLGLPYPAGYPSPPPTRYTGEPPHRGHRWSGIIMGRDYRVAACEGAVYSPSVRYARIVRCRRHRTSARYSSLEGTAPRGSRNKHKKPPGAVSDKRCHCTKSDPGSLHTCSTPVLLHIPGLPSHQDLSTLNGQCLEGGSGEFLSGKIKA